LCRTREMFCVADHHCPQWHARRPGEHSSGPRDG
jgi:hypothetical protein